ncbi:MAG: hypothetical protein AB7V18_03870 [Pyrinomonadaceae bacterium]
MAKCIAGTGAVTSFPARIEWQAEQSIRRVWAEWLKFPTYLAARSTGPGDPG